jgi:multidrug efflux pump subunit AcrA (membrane-fusion protein)
MKRTSALVAVTVVSLGGCRSKPASSTGDMPGMTHTQEDTAATRQPVHLTAAQAQAIGVRYTVVQRGPLGRTVRTVGTVAPPESRLAEITTKIDGFVDRLLVDATGVTLRKGEPLLTLYSPMLVAAQ